MCYLTLYSTPSKMYMNLKKKKNIIVQRIKPNLLFRPIHKSIAKAFLN